MENLNLGFFENKSVSWVMVDNGVIVLIPMRTLLSVALAIDHLKYSSIVFKDLTRANKDRLERLPLSLVLE